MFVLIQEQLDITGDELTLPPVPSLRKDCAYHKQPFI